MTVLFIILAIAVYAIMWITIFSLKIQKKELAKKNDEKQDQIKKLNEEIDLLSTRKN